MPLGKQLEDRVCIVTGAASGIGEATAKLFSAEGARVIVADIQEDRGRGVVHAITSQGGAASFFRLDVADEYGWAEMMALALKSHNRLDVLVNCAGIGFMKSIAEMSLSDWRKVMRTNLESVFLGLKHASPIMAKNGTRGGAIINISSSLALKPSPGHAAYTVSKAGVSMLTKIAAIELAEKNIRVNTVYPGPTRTPIWDPLTSRLPMTKAEFEKVAGKITLLGRMADAIDIAQAALYFASDAAGYVTGAELLVDGGEVLHREQKLFDTVQPAADIVFKKSSQ